MMDWACKRHHCNGKSYFSTFTENEAVAQVGSSEAIQPAGYGAVRSETTGCYQSMLCFMMCFLHLIHLPE